MTEEVYVIFCLEIFFYREHRAIFSVVRLQAANNNNNRRMHPLTQGISLLMTKQSGVPIRSDDARGDEKGGPQVTRYLLRMCPGQAWEHRIDRLLDNSNEIVLIIISLMIVHCGKH